MNSLARLQQELMQRGHTIDINDLIEALYDADVELRDLPANRRGPVRDRQNF